MVHLTPRARAGDGDSVPEGRGRREGFQPCFCLTSKPLACSFVTYKADEPLVDGQWTEQAVALQTVQP